jgi:hypothetical protein
MYLKFGHDNFRKFCAEQTTVAIANDKNIDVECIKHRIPLPDGHGGSVSFTR